MRRPTGSGSVTPVSEVLEKTLAEIGLLTKSKRFQVFSVWPKVVGDIARHAKPRRLDGDVLFVATSSSAWSQELTYMRESILARLREALKGDYVREIRFSEHLWESSALERRPKVGLPAMAKCEGEAFMDAITDRRLARSAKKYSGTMARRKLFLLRRGYVHCQRCGCLYPSSKRKCPYCAVQREWRAKRRAIAILEKAPHLTDQEVLGLVGSDDVEPVRWARLELESKLLAVARSALSAEAGKEPVDASEFLEAVYKMASLRTNKPVTEMTVDEIEKAVGKRIFLAAKRGSPWNRGRTWAQRT